MNIEAEKAAEENSPGAEGESALAPQWDLVTALVCIALGIGAMIESWRMPRFEHLDVNPYTVPGLVPGILGAVLTFLGVILLIRASWRGGWHFRGAADQAGTVLRKPETTQLALTLLVTVGYAAGLVGRIPFWTATFLFVTCFIVLFEWRGGRPWGGKEAMVRIALAAVEGLIVATAVTLVFERVFLVRLP